ncbi:hypothetical protein AMTRI_Chr12g268940 [Amborella trichopoda]
MKISSFSLLILTVMLVLSNGLPTTAVACNVTGLQACYPAYYNSLVPTPACCSGLNRFKPCHCQILKVPSYARMINSSNGQRIAKACKISIPKC